MEFLGMGFGEILLILVVILIVVGPTKIAGVAKDLGKIVNNLRKASSEVKAQLSKAAEEEEKKSPATRLFTKGPPDGSPGQVNQNSRDKTL